METPGIYIQVPFCASKCSFCNFSSRVAPVDVYDDYCGALCAEIDQLNQFYEAAGIDWSAFAATVDTVYIGGGTPSLLGSARLSKIIKRLYRHFRFASHVEFTLEFTPGSADSYFLKHAREAGINRLSIGAQSFTDAELRSVGRLHSAEDARQAVKVARGQGFTNVSLDLIAGLPHQTEESWQATLRSAMELRPEHISVYLLEVDEKSRLGGEVLRHGSRYHADFVPDDDFMAGAYDRARAVLQQQGYIQYEISNFALPGFESAHNLKYWQLKPYAGLGAGAHSFDGRCRWQNETSVPAYQTMLAHNESPIQELHQLSPGEQIEEFFFLGLRRREGVNILDAVQRWGSEFVAPWMLKLDELERDEWLKRAGNQVRLADRALLVSNEIFQEFVAA